MTQDTTELFKQSIVVKVMLLTVFFSLVWIVLFYQPPQPDYKSDHIHDEQIQTGTPKTFTERSDIDARLVDAELEQLAEALLTNEHNAASTINFKEKYAEICTIYKDICQKTIRQGDYSERDTLLYQTLLIYLIKQIDSRLVGHPTVRTTLSQLIHLQNGVDKRGRAGHTHVKMNTEKISHYIEYREVLTHELGHILDLGSIKGNSPQQHEEFTEFGSVKRSVDDPSIAFYEISRRSEDVRDAQATYKDFVSGYAMKGIYEDFAETFNLYFNHHALFRELASTNSQLAAKYGYFQELFNSSYFKENQGHLSAVNAETRPWDTTKISGR